MIYIGKLTPKEVQFLKEIGVSGDLMNLTPESDEWLKIEEKVAATEIADPGAPEITIPPGTEKAMAVEDMGAALTGVNQVGDDQTGVVDLDIGIGEALLEIRPQRLAEGRFGQIDGGGTG